jgi:branched-chain amino acid transport system permease protein
MEILPQMLIQGIAVGAIYSLVALGFVLIYKASGVFNIAQGAFMMVGAFVCWSFLIQMGFPFWLSIVLTMLVATILALLVERLTLRPLIGQPLIAVIMMTVALLDVLKGLVFAVFGADERGYMLFAGAEPLTLGSVSLGRELVFGLGISIVMVGIFGYVFTRTRQGLAMRAMAEDQQVAQSMGIRASRVYQLSWVIAAIVAGVGGILLGLMTMVSPGIGALGLKVLPVAIVGGLDSIMGVIIAGPLIGVIENVATAYLDPLLPGGGGLMAVAPFIFMLIFMLFKPYGIFGLQRIERI